MLQNLTKPLRMIFPFQTADGGWHDRIIPLRKKPQDAYPFDLLDHRWEAYVADMSSDAAWSGIITGIRLRFLAEEGYLTVYDISITSRT